MDIIEPFFVFQMTAELLTWVGEAVAGPSLAPALVLTAALVLGEESVAAGSVLTA